MDAKLHAAEKKGGMLGEKDRLKIMKSLNPYKEYTFEVTNSKEEFEKMITLKRVNKFSVDSDTETYDNMLGHTILGSFAYGVMVENELPAASMWRAGKLLKPALPAATIISNEQACYGIPKEFYYINYHVVIYVPNNN